VEAIDSFTDLLASRHQYHRSGQQPFSAVVQTLEQISLASYLAASERARGSELEHFRSLMLDDS
jgi:hypothetical protein